ncbi:MAG: tetratricopeptide repeat protein [Deltaproteobacteria bacterium]|nr:tetratricopeptide repeat protein [Deltaproteobacteria bacterium]
MNAFCRTRPLRSLGALALLLALAAAAPAAAQSFDELTAAREAVSATPTDAAAQLRLGNALLEARELSGAKTAFEAALRQHADWVDALWGLARIKMAEGNYEDSQTACRRVVSAAGSAAAEGHVCMGQAYLVWRRSSLAIEEFNKALEADADNAAALSGLGDSQARANQLDAAVEQYRKAIAADANLLEAHLGLANVLERKSDSAGAIAELRTAVGIRAWSADAQYNLGRLLSDVNEAITHLALAVAIRPSFTDAQMEYGKKLAAAGRWSEALAPLRVASSQLPNVGAVNELLGIALWKNGELAEAETKLRAALVGVPNSPRANEALGEVLIANGHIEDGLASLETAANLEQSNQALALRIATVLRGQGRNTLATGWLDKALTLKADLSAAHEMYGDILFEQGRYSEARPHYESALSGDGVGIDRARVQGRIEQLRTLAPQ